MTDEIAYIEPKVSLFRRGGIAVRDGDGNVAKVGLRPSDMRCLARKLNKLATEIEDQVATRISAELVEGD